ncbi:MAG: GNAT family N-acetyltransferase [Myxococcota bacterium]
MRVEVIDGVSAVATGAWDALVGPDDPFAEHAFLEAFEKSGTVGGRSGWGPRHVLAWEGRRLVGALPLYAKDHSFGEFIFDWGWAEAAHRAGIPYYPKLVSMAPVTPATGQRLLLAPDADAPRVVRALTEEAIRLAGRDDASSVHLLFLNPAEHALVQETGRFMHRLSYQFHWHNRGYGSFDDFLGTFRSQLRKQVRKERRRVAESQVEVRALEGGDLDGAHWDALERFYRITCARYGSYPYLTPVFFRLAREQLAHRVLAVFAYLDDEPVAASLNFEKGAHLYGRYWGCTEEHDFLHFELCYYRLIERAIQRGMRRFEAGAQGTHKLRRGLEPSPIHSAHWIRHPALARAVEEFLPREARAAERTMAELARHGPYRRDGS